MALRDPLVPGLGPYSRKPYRWALGQPADTSQAPALLSCALYLGFCLRSHFWILLLENILKSEGLMLFLRCTHGETEA